MLIMLDYGQFNACMECLLSINITLKITSKLKQCKTINRIPVMIHVCELAHVGSAYLIHSYM
ncbi:hypothetical protein Hanom_Chr09g00764071 [Helianthus anomalus]